MTCRRFIYVGLLDRTQEIEELGCLHDPLEYLGHHRFVLDIERQGRATRTLRDRLARFLPQWVCGQEKEAATAL
jgi:hypothetical protein